MRSRRWASWVGAVWLAGAVPAPAGAETLPKVVRDYIADLEAYCQDGLEHGADVSKQAFSDDGRPDYLVDESAVRCLGEPLPPYCGATGYCSFRVFVSKGRGFATADFSARDHEVKKDVLVVEGKRLRWNGRSFSPKGR